MGNILVNLSQEENLGLRHGRDFENEVLCVVSRSGNETVVFNGVMVPGKVRSPGLKCDADKVLENTGPRRRHPPFLPYNY